MITYRSFRNSDPPALVEIWRSVPHLAGLAETITTATLDNLVLAKPYFDPHGLIVAVDDHHPIGFVHAGFGPNTNEDSLDHRRGILSMLMVVDPEDHLDVAAELLDQAEAFLQHAGATEATAIGLGTLCPYYLGLYGGSELPGVLDSDPVRKSFFQSHGYESIDQVRLYRRELDGFRPAVDRVQFRIRRANQVSFVADPPPRTWWEGCTRGCFEQLRAELRRSEGGPLLASALFWNMEPLTEAWGAHTMGLTQIEVNDDQRHEGLATFLLNESLSELESQGFQQVQGQVMQGDTAAAHLLEKLGFTQVDTATVLRKQLFVVPPLGGGSAQTTA